MAKETLKYEEAMTRLENIVADMENGNLDIDSLCEKVKTAQKLIKMCRDKLTRTAVSYTHLTLPTKLEV